MKVWANRRYSKKTSLYCDQVASKESSFPVKNIPTETGHM